MTNLFNNGYSFLVGLEKTVLRLLVVGAPLILEVLPETWMNLTVGGIVVFLINFAKNRKKKLSE